MLYNKTNKDQKRSYDHLHRKALKKKVNKLKKEKTYLNGKPKN